ncbi:MAG: relaxase domain-containing protein, partial [Chloroflexota bacterium]|nr:relaxase domain-containing protein [Chloroflexota bacterium]
LGYGIEKTHADGRFEIAGVSREAVDAFSTRRAEIEAAMEARGLGLPGENPRLAERAALMTRAAKRDVGRQELRAVWTQQAADLGFDAGGLVAEARDRSAGAETVAHGVTPETGFADRDGAKSGAGVGPEREGPDGGVVGAAGRGTGREPGSGRRFPADHPSLRSRRWSCGVLRFSQRIPTAYAPP